MFARESKYGIAGYVPANESSSRYTILAIMTDGSLILNDQRGNEISFDPAGRLKGIRASVVKGLSQGDYKIELDHELIHGEPRIVEARATQGDHAGTLCVVKYEYGQDQRLARVVTPALQKSQSNPDEGKMTAARKDGGDQE